MKVKVHWPPTIGTGVFDNCAENLQIQVPISKEGTGGFPSYLVAPNWSAYADKMVGF